MEKEILQKNIESYTLINEAKKYTEKKTKKHWVGRINRSSFGFLLMPRVQILLDCCNNFSIVAMLTLPQVLPQVATVLSLLIICRCFSVFIDDRYRRSLDQSADVLSTSAFDFIVGCTSPRIVRLQWGS